VQPPNAPPELFPRFLPPPSPSPATGGVLHYSQATYAIVPGYRPLLMDLWVPARISPPVVVWVHGGAWLLGDRRHLPFTLRPGQVFDALLSAGTAVASIDYRHSREAVFPAQLHDTKAALRYLHAHRDVLGVDTSRIGLWGESAGAYLAALAALTAGRGDLEGDVGAAGPSGTVRAVVDWYGVSDVDSVPELAAPPQIANALPPGAPTDPLDLLLEGVDGATRAAASPLAHVGPCAPPFLIVHGTADTAVPPRQSEILHAALTAAGATSDLVLVPGADHVFAGYDDVDALVARAVTHLDRHLGTADPRTAPR
jgi:acetyl esterase/lipase